MTKKGRSKKLNLDYENVDGYYYFADGEIYSPAEVEEIKKLSEAADLSAVHKIKKTFKGTVLNVRRSLQTFQGEKEYY